MSRARGRGSYRSSGSRGASARQGPHPIFKAFEFLAECCYDRGGQIGDSEWKPQDFVFPFSSDDSDVALSDYYDHCHYGALFRAPKVLSYRRCKTKENVIKSKVEDLLRSMYEKALQQSQGCTPEPDCLCRLEIDLIKIFLTFPESFNDSSVTMADLKGKIKTFEENKRSKKTGDNFNINTIRVFLSSGVDALIGVLKELGAKQTNKETKPDTLRCSCFRKNFRYKDRSFESSLFVDPSDLVFCNFQSIIYPGEGMCLANPGSENYDDDDDDYFVCDLRIKAKTKVERTVDDFQQLWNNLEEKPPPTLTEPGLNGLVRRKGDGYECEPEAHINELLEKTNKVVNHFELEGFTVIVSTVNGREFNVDKESGRCEVRYSYECWPKLLFILDDKERIPELADLAYRCVMALFDALSERRLEVRPWRCFGNLPGGVNVASVDAQLLRRIQANDSLDDMLGVSGERTRRVLSNRLAEVLQEMKGMSPVRDLDPDELRRKLVAAAKARDVEVKEPTE